MSNLSMMFSSTLLLLCCTAVSEAALKLRTPSYREDGILCDRYCDFRRLFQQSPCHLSGCELGDPSENVLRQVFTILDAQDNKHSIHDLPSRFVNMQKRVKEVWEGPAPADINH